MQQVAPHPSTLEPYRPPVVRPYEPTSDFGRERPAEGDDTGQRYRAPITAPVAVEAYSGAYEFSPRASEAVYDMAVRAAEARADQMAGPMDGGWRLLDAHRRPLLRLMLSDRDGRIEGGWRNAGAAFGYGGAAMDGSVLSLEGYGQVTLEAVEGGFHGVLERDGRRTRVTVTR